MLNFPTREKMEVYKEIQNHPRELSKPNTRYGMENKSTTRCCGKDLFSLSSIISMVMKNG